MDLPLNLYTKLLADIKGRIQASQTRAVMAVNAEMIRLYWSIGRLLEERQSTEGWGAGVIPRLANDLRNDLPELKGFSSRNLDRMLAFARAYPEPGEFSPQAVAKLQGKVISPQPVARPMSDSLLWQVPWGHHALLLEKVKPAEVRLWYMAEALAQGWSRATLMSMVDSQAHDRQGVGVSNFGVRLLAPQSELVAQTLKDPYVFDFLTIEEPFRERELETGLVQHLEKFLLELGQGFAFMGRQYKVVVSEQDYFIDLLFFHVRLRCYVVIELKRGEFKPEYAGKLNFYCNVVDDQLKHADDAPTIGLILCQSSDKVLAEYALRGIDKPIGVSTFELTRALPTSLRSSLPSIDEIEAELSNGIDNWAE